MRYSLLLFLLAALVLAGCAESPPQASLPPRIEGRVKTVSRADIREAIAVAERDMMKRHHRLPSIETVYVANHDLIKVSFRGPHFISLVPVERVHGVWLITAEWVNVTG